MVERRLDQGRRERLNITGPAVVSFERGPDLRRAGLAAALAAKTAMVTSRQAGQGNDGRTALQPGVIARGPYRPPTNVKPAPTGSTRDRLLALTGSGLGDNTARLHEVSAEEAARLAVAQLQQWGYVARPDDQDGESLP